MKAIADREKPTCYTNQRGYFSYCWKLKEIGWRFLRPWMKYLYKSIKWINCFRVKYFEQEESCYSKMWIDHWNINIIYIGDPIQRMPYPVSCSNFDLHSSYGSKKSKQFNQAKHENCVLPIWIRWHSHELLSLFGWKIRSKSINV